MVPTDPFHIVRGGTRIAPNGTAVSLMLGAATIALSERKRPCFIHCRGPVPGCSPACYGGADALFELTDAALSADRVNDERLFSLLLAELR